MKTKQYTATLLRKQGKSYNEINQILGIPKSTLSYWLKDVEMPVGIKKKFWDKTRRKWAYNITQFNKKRAILARERAEKIQCLASKDIHKLSKRELFLVGVALYWAEGHKRSRWRADFSNADPGMIKLMMRFFREICHVREDRFFAAAQIHPNVTAEGAINYWSKITRIPKNQFLKTYSRVTPSSKGKRAINRLPYGTLRVSVSHMELINKIKGWILGLEKLI